jgi:hypothetical protein
MRIRTLQAVLLAGVLVLPACGSADQVVAPPGVVRQTRIVRAQLRPAGWRVTLVLPGHTTRICGDGRKTVRMSVSAVASGVAAVAPIGHPHLTAWLFPQPGQAAACLTRFAVARGVPDQPDDGLLVLHTLNGPEVAATAGRYFVIVSTAGPLAPMRRAAERALARL